MNQGSLLRGRGRSIGGGGGLLFIQIKNDHINTHPMSIRII